MPVLVNSTGQPSLSTPITLRISSVMSNCLATITPRSFLQGGRGPAGTLPERCPRGERLGQLALAPDAAAIVGRRQPQRTGQHVGAVPQPVNAADEVPRTVASFVRVAVLDLLHDPFAVLFGLCVAIDDAPSVIVVVEIDHVVRHLED